MNLDLTLDDIAQASRLRPRTIRSWVAQGLVPGPKSRGPHARYSAETLDRVLAIRAMRDLLGMSMATIRQELLLASSDRIRSYASKAAGLAPEPEDKPTTSAPGDALAYVRSLRSGNESAGGPPMLSVGVAELPGAHSVPPASGFEELERRLAEGRPQRSVPRSRADEWLRLSITPDVELAIRGPLDDEQRARLERCADLIRDILTGSNR